MNAPALSLPSTAELQDRLRTVEPAAFLVPRRLLRRIIKEDAGIGGISFHVPHDEVYSIPVERLLTIVERADLGINAETLPTRLILLASFDKRLPPDRDSALLDLWRRLFHARLDAALDDLRTRGELTDARIRDLVQRVGVVEVEEGFRVLRQEKRLLPPDDLATAFREFVVLFFELRFFSPRMLPAFLPALEQPDAAAAILSDLVDAEGLFRQTRLPDAPLPTPRRTHATPHVEPEQGQATAPAVGAGLLASARRAAAQGNLVRSALLKTRAAARAAPDQAAALQADAESDVAGLVDRLRAPLHLDDAQAAAWRGALQPLLLPASRGIWPRAARLLYDLQKVCVDDERELFAVDLVEWVCSLGKKAVKRAVPLQSEARLVKHLRSATGRIAAVPIDDASRHRLAELLHDATQRRETLLRERIRPILSCSLADVGFGPANRAEEISLAKLVEELLDRIVDRGFINMGDVRDAISRNQLKLPDANPKDVVLGDLLLKANRKLAVTLDGVYHRGEVYLRWLQRFSSVLFGTLLGRLLTLFVLLPFGGALATGIFLQEMLHLAQIPVDLGLELTQGRPRAAHAASHSGHWHAPLPAVLFALFLLGLFFLLLIHLPRFRAATWSATKHVGRMLRAVFWEWPWAFFQLRPVRAILDSWPVALFRRRILRPVIVGLTAFLVWRLLPFNAEGGYDDVAAGVIPFALALLFFNSRLGQRTEEAVADWLAGNWYWLHNDVVPGLIRLILDVFQTVLDRIERVLYAVDEWFRFRPGDSRLGLIYKPFLGLIWFLLTYVIRVVINLFVEPTVNPIKHFPAVTVGAKLIIPLLPAWHFFLRGELTPFLGRAVANGISVAILFLLPGIFGFAVWELKENWKLYRANRRKNLGPVMIGHHGETMLRLMRPGFHSGTLPKLFAKLRHALQAGQGHKAHKQEEAIHHLHDSVRHFIERDGIAALNGSGNWRGLPLSVDGVRLASNRVEVALACPALAAPPVRLAFDERSGWLSAGILAPGWIGLLDQRQTMALRTALTGLYKLAGVHLVREHLDASLPGPWLIESDAIVVFPGADFDSPRRLTLAPPLAPETQRLLFSTCLLSWDAWVAAWQRDQAGEPPTLAGFTDVTLLPPDTPSRGA